jgi:hypothetical protein
MKTHDAQQRITESWPGKAFVVFDILNSERLYIEAIEYVLKEILTERLKNVAPHFCSTIKRGGQKNGD